jgi:3-hydroxybutyryl-CoA dehydrogenase
MIETIGVIGSGAMGRGICQWAVESGAVVLVFDSKEGASAGARAYIADIFERSVSKGRLTSGARDDMLGRLKIAQSLPDLADADFVIEAIVEDLAVKQRLFAELENIVVDNAIICTNTSSLSITGCASACRVPERVIGLHFFNPAPLMKVVEVVKGERTTPETTGRVVDFVRRTQHKPIVCDDTPGFVVNHAGRGLSTEGLRIVQEGVAEFVDVDRVVREYVGLPMGPFELFDLTGLDVSSRVLMEIYDGFFQEPRYRPSPLVYRRVGAKLYGRKVGAGFYSYIDGKKMEPKEVAPLNESRGTMFVHDNLALSELLLQAGTALERSPSQADAIVVCPFGDDATATAVSLGYDPRKVVAVDTLLPEKLTKGGRATLMLTPVTEPHAADTAHAALLSAGLLVTRISDSPGFIAQRIVANIVNTACEIAQQRIASPDDVEEGVKRGLGYPLGPFALGDKVGGGRILEILRRLQALTGDPRYRPSVWLRRRVELGVSLATTER